MGFFDDLARKMAEMNISPESIAPMISQHLGSLVEPIPTNESFPNARKAISDFNQNPQIPGFSSPPSVGMSMQGVPRSPGPAQQANLPQQPNNFSFGGLLKDLLNPMPTNESFPNARELWNRPILPGVAPGGESQYKTAQAPAGGTAPMQGPPMSAMMGPEQGPPQSAQMALSPPNLGSLMQPQAQPQAQVTSNFPMRPEGQPTGQTVGKPFDDFMSTVHAGGLTNNYGLAAVAATGTRESGWNQNRIAGTWSDPSQSGQSGTSGGALSWRGPRYQNMLDFAQQNGLDPYQASTQAKFFMQEDPNLIAKLNSANSPQEAQAAMNNAWAFAGYDDPNNSETKARFQKANDFSGAFAGGVGNWTEAMNKAGVKTSESGNNSSPVQQTGGTGIGATETTHGVVDPATAKPKTFGQKLGELGKNIKAPENQRPKPPTGTAPAPQPGNYRPDPQQLQMLMAMLGAGGSQGIPQVGPTLADLLNGSGGRRRG